MTLLALDVAITHVIAKAKNDRVSHRGDSARARNAHGCIATQRLHLSGASPTGVRHEDRGEISCAGAIAGQSEGIRITAASASVETIDRVSIVFIRAAVRRVRVKVRIFNFESRQLFRLRRRFAHQKIDLLENVTADLRILRCT